ALVAERTGFDSIWIMDHLVPEHPLGYEGQLDSFEAWTFATALAARTSHIRVAHAVLCDGFRHPALPARMASRATSGPRPSRPLRRWFTTTSLRRPCPRSWASA